MIKFIKDQYIMDFKSKHLFLHFIEQCVELKEIDDFFWSFNSKKFDIFFLQNFGLKEKIMKLLKNDQKILFELNNPILNFHKFATYEK